MTSDEGFRHEAFFYANRDEFLAGTVPFIREGLAAGEPTLVVVDAGKIALLRAALGSSAEAVRFADMAAVGKNPARIIPTWRQFVAEHAGPPPRRLHGIGEPVWAGRSPVELVECRHLEALLNVALAEVGGGLRLLCPYDTATLDPTVVSDALATHPWACNSNRRYPSPSYRGVDPADLYCEPLPAPPPERRELFFDRARPVRKFVSERAAEAGVHPAKIPDVVLAVNEIATNSLRHGGGTGLLTVWSDPETGTLTCQVRDRGWITDPLVGRRSPTNGQRNGRGLWMVNQLCDVAQMRTSAEGTVTRLHFRTGGGWPRSGPRQSRASAS